MMTDSATHEATLARLAEGLLDGRMPLTREWLEQLQLTVLWQNTDGLDRAGQDCGSAVPAHQLLEQIPQLIQGIAHHLQSSAVDTEMTVSVASLVAELGESGRPPRASIRRLLSEYQVLASLVERWFECEIPKLEGIETAAAVQMMRRVSESVRAVEQKILDAFVSHYAEAMEHQIGQFRQLSHLVTQDVRQPLAVLQVVSKTLPCNTEDLETARIMDIFERNISRLAEASGKLERLANAAAR